MLESNFVTTFSDSLPNDGHLEYTASSDCDGSHKSYWARTPRSVAEAGNWEQVTKEQWEAARYAE